MKMRPSASVHLGLLGLSVFVRPNGSLIVCACTRWRSSGIRRKSIAGAACTVAMCAISQWPSAEAL